MQSHTLVAQAASQLFRCREQGIVILRVGEPQFSSLSSTGSLAHLDLSVPQPSSCIFLCFILHQSLDSVARRAVQCNDLGAGRAHRLGAHWTRGGNPNLKYFMDGLPETVEVVVY